MQFINLAGGEQHFMLFADGRSTRDRRANVARGAAPCSERSDAKQPGLSIVQAVSSAGRTYSRQESIEVRPLFKGILPAPAPSMHFSNASVR